MLDVKFHIAANLAGVTQRSSAQEAANIDARLAHVIAKRSIGIDAAGLLKQFEG